MGGERDEGCARQGGRAKEGRGMREIGTCCAGVTHMQEALFTTLYGSQLPPLPL